MQAIFVNIASFVDPLLFFTVKQLLTQAKYPERLRIGIVDQGLVDHSWLYNSHPGIQYQFIPAPLSEGVCWARSQAQQLFQDESYYLQIDSHCLFEPDWDTELVEQLNALDNHTDRPILTTYPPGFEIDPTGQICYNANQPGYSLCLVPGHDASMSPDDPVFQFQGVWKKTKMPNWGFHIAGGFLFTRGSFVNEIPYDPMLYFHGEEQNLALRAFTHGWDIIHPEVIPLRHLYKRAGNSTLSHHWHPEWEAYRAMKWTERHEIAKKRMVDLIEGKLPAGSQFGLGTERTLADYNAFCGINYPGLTIKPMC